MKKIFIELGETCGIEFEVENLVSSDLMGKNIENWFKTKRDASIESDRRQSNGIILNLDKIKNTRFERIISTSSIVTGTELVSGILNSGEDKFFDIIKELTNFLCEMGETPGKRSGIHFHFSMPNPNLRILKSLLRLGRYLEAVFYTVSGMGGEFRGIENNSTYCRPITKFGPTCVPISGGKWAQVFNISDVLKSKTTEEFWERYGDLENHGLKYNPVRYMWLNLYPLYPNDLYKGTVEFRAFNPTLNPKFIYAAAMLCKHFVNFAVKSSYDTLLEDDLLKENSIYDNPSLEQVKQNLLTFSELARINPETVEVLLKIMKLSGVPRLEEGYFYTHIRGDLIPYWQNSTYKPKEIEEKIIKKLNYVDIHTLRGEI